MSTILLPVVNNRALKYVRKLSATLSDDLDVVIPSSPEGLTSSSLRELGKYAASVRTFSTEPQIIMEEHLSLALLAATQYELGTIAIPVHYQNIRDRLRNRYGFQTLRDIQVARILDKSQIVLEGSPGVYKARVRFRTRSHQKLIAGWVRFIQGGGFTSVYDLPDYCAALEHCFSSPLPASASCLLGQPSPVYAWIEVRTAEGNDLYLVRPRQEQSLRLTSRGDLGFCKGVTLSLVLDSQTGEIDEVTIKQMTELERVSRRLKHASPGKEILDALYDYAALWFEHIPVQRVRGQSQKWRGWYLVPEHGPLTAEKLVELQRILAAIQSLSTGGTVLVDSSPKGVATVASLLKAGRVSYRQRYTNLQKRNLFIRQQKNYLIRLGLVTEPARNQLGLTELGTEWASIANKQALLIAFRDVLMELRWTWCNMPYFRFLCELVDKCDGTVNYRELFNWVIHVYEHRQLDDTVRAIHLYRSLPHSKKDQLNKRIENRLKALLERNISSTAFGHYRSKLRDLMTAFASSGEFNLLSSGEGRLVRRKLSS